MFKRGPKRIEVIDVRHTEQIQEKIDKLQHEIDRIWERQEYISKWLREIKDEIKANQEWVETYK